LKILFEERKKRRLSETYFKEFLPMNLSAKDALIIVKERSLFKPLFCKLKISTLSKKVLTHSLKVRC
jgi:hypothetical protein